jgi:periplasmic protein TonB
MESLNNLISLTNKRLFQKYSFISRIRVGIKTNKMKTELILKSDVLDILFENRNKDYGAYNLRKFYDNRLMKSVAVMIGVVIILSAFTFIPKKKVVKISDDYSTKMYTLPPVKDKMKEPEKPKENHQLKEKVASQIFTTPVVVNKDKESVKPLATLSDTAEIASFTDIGKPGSVPIVADLGDGDIAGKGNDPEPAKPIIDIITPRDNAEVMPSYPGGMEALRKFLQRNLNNPKEMEEGEEVSVKVKFVVDYDGKLQSFVTVQDGGEEFNKEVVRVLKKMPNWVPGKTNGQNVSVYFTIPVKFVPAN